jgi:hypothetical protein
MEYIDNIDRYIRVDFIEQDDVLCKISSLITDYSAIHVGIQVEDWYLLPIRGRQAQWRQQEPMNRLLRGQIKDSFLICPCYFDPSLVSMLGHGFKTSPLWWIGLTEPFHYLNDAGINVPLPERNTCAEAVARMLRSMGLDVKARSARFLYRELMTNDRAIHVG